MAQTFDFARFVLYVSLINAGSFVGLAILFWLVLVNLNASTVAFIEICGNCPSLFYMFTNTTLNRLGFGMLTVETAVFDCIC